MLQILMTRSVGMWKLPPLIDVQENNKWVSIPRMSRTIPFGYEIDETDDNILVPIPDQLNKLETAKQYLKQYSYREVANWLSTNTGRTISYEGLRKRLDNEQKRKEAEQRLNLDKTKAMMNQGIQEYKLEQHDALAKLRANTSIEKTILSNTIPSAPKMDAMPGNMALITPSGE